MKKRLIACMALAVLVALPGVSEASQALFLQKCGACHKKGGTAAPINPADKAASVWEKYFARGRHPGDPGASGADLKSVIDYLKAHAADSDQPAAAVIPK